LWTLLNDVSKPELNPYPIPNVTIGRVARSKNIKKAKFGHKQFQKGEIMAKFSSKMTSFKVRISESIASFSQISEKQALKYTIFLL